MGRFFRAWAIVWVVLRYGLDELVLSSFQHPWLSRLRRIVTFGRKLNAPRGQRLRQALEELGPFGQRWLAGGRFASPDLNCRRRPSAAIA